MSGSTAERQLLAALVAGRDVDSAAIVRPEHFSQLRDGLLWRAGWEILDMGGRVTPVALEQALRRLGDESDDGTPVWQLDQIVMLDSPYTSEHDIREAAQAVRRDAHLRTLRTLGNDLAKASQHPAADPDVLASEYQRRLELQDTSDGLIDYGDALRRRYEAARREARGEVVIPRVSTGLRSLDEALDGGMRPGWLVVIGARPGMGKSAVAWWITRHAARTVPALFFSAEMGEDELAERAIADGADVPVQTIRKPGVVDLAQMHGFVERSAGVRLAIDDRTRYMPEVISKARRWRRRHSDPAALIVIDYLQKYRGERNKQDTRENEVARMSSDLKDLATSTSSVVIALAQLNRELERRGENLKDPKERALAKRPRMSDLRESGALEQDANVLGMLFRPAVYEPHEFPGSQVELGIEKFREGRAPQRVCFGFAPKTMSFYEEHDR